jgi:hypothetical protein
MEEFSWVLPQPRPLASARAYSLISCLFTPKLLTRVYYPPLPLIFGIIGLGCGNFPKSRD